MEENIYDHIPAEKQKQMTISECDKVAIVSSCKWARFLALFGFVVLGLVLLGCLSSLFYMLASGMMLSGFYNMGMKPMLVPMLICYIVVILIYFFPLFCLYRYASKGLIAVENNDDEQMTESLFNLSRYFKFIGIFTITILALTLISCVIAIVVGVQS